MVAALGLGTLASPPETARRLRHRGRIAPWRREPLSSSGDSVNGTFSVARSGLSGVNLTFTSQSSSGLDQMQFLPTSRIQATLVPAGPGQVNIFGTVSMTVSIGALVFLDGRAR